MFHVYVLRSLRNGKRYTGMTNKMPAIRLAEHNSGTNVFTRQNGPFELVHIEEFPDRTRAAQREKFLKSGQGRQLLDEIIPR